jgi:predicted TIM-barrel fold metal-dependent hydrolase
VACWLVWGGSTAFARPGVIDFHTHLDGRASARIDRIMQRSGVEVMVNLSGGHFGRGLRAAVALARKMPGRIVNFYTPDWSDINEPWWGVREAERLERAVAQHGFRGLKIAKALGLYLRDPAGRTIDVDDPRFDPLWSRAGELGIPVSIHVGDPKAFWLPPDEHNERYEELSVHPGWSFYGQPVPTRAELLAARDRVIDRHTLTTFVCVHFGNNPEDLSDVRRLLHDYPNTMVDVAARLPEIGRHPASEVRSLFVEHATRILFGTDIAVGTHSLMLGSTGKERPNEDDAARFYATHWRFFESEDRGFAHPTPVQGNWTIDAIGLPEDVREKIYRGNARKLLGLVP